MANSGGADIDSITCDMNITYKENYLTQEEIDAFDIEPLMFRLVVKELDPEKVGRLYIPDSAVMKKSNQGWIVAAGPDVDLVHVGQLVYYGQYSGHVIMRGRRKYYIMNEKDILGVIKSPKEGAK